VKGAHSSRVDGRSTGSEGSCGISSGVEYLSPRIGVVLATTAEPPHDALLIMFRGDQVLAAEPPARLAGLTPEVTRGRAFKASRDGTPWVGSHAWQHFPFYREIAQAPETRQNPLDPACQSPDRLSGTQTLDHLEDRQESSRGGAKVVDRFIDRPTAAARKPLSDPLPKRPPPLVERLDEERPRTDPRDVVRRFPAPDPRQSSTDGPTSRLQSERPPFAPAHAHERIGSRLRSDPLSCTVPRPSAPLQHQSIRSGETSWLGATW